MRISILSVDFFENLCENVKPPLVNVKIAMVTATGEVSPYHGKGNFSVTLNGKDFIHEMWVAPIKGDGILGMDFLMKHKCDVMLSQQMIKFGNNSIPCYQSSVEASCCRVIVAETTNIPANSESILQGKVMDVEANYSPRLIDQSEIFSDRDKLMDATAVIDVSNNKVPIKVINLTDKDIRLYKNSFIAECIEINEVGDKVSPKVCSCQVQDLKIIPKHLERLYEDSCENLNEEKRQKVKEMLVKYQTLFSESSTDIGRTSLVTRRIDTQGAKPIKQRARRVPLAKQQIVKDSVQEMKDAEYHRTVVWTLGFTGCFSD